MEQLFDTVVVPETVYNEATRPGKKEALPLKAFLRGKVRQVDLQGYVFLDAFADAGETSSPWEPDKACG